MVIWRRGDDVSVISFMRDNLLTCIAVLVAVVSLLVSYNTLRLTVLKRGKLEIIVFNEPGDVNVNIGGRYDGVATNSYFSFAVIVKNSGAQSLAFKNIKWRVISPEFFDADVFTQPEFGADNGLIVLEPYQQKIGTLQMKFILKEYGTGYANPNYLKFKEQAAEYKGDTPCFIELEYEVFSDKSKIDKKVNRIPITDIIVNNIVEK